MEGMYRYVSQQTNFVHYELQYILYRIITSLKYIKENKYISIYVKQSYKNVISKLYKNNYNDSINDPVKVRNMYVLSPAC